MSSTRTAPQLLVLLSLLALLPRGKPLTISVCPDAERVAASTAAGDASENRTAGHHPAGYHAAGLHAAGHHVHVDSLAAARDLVRAIIRDDGADQPITVELCPGRHPITAPLLLGPEDSGSAAAPITYTSAPGGVAILDGGYAVTGWELNTTTGHWRAPIPVSLQTRQMWVNDRRAIRARSLSPVISGTITAAGYVATQISPCTGCPAGPLASWLPGTEFVFQPRGASWTEPRCGVVGAQTLPNGSTAVTMAQPCFTVARGKGQGQNVNFPAYVENSLVLLDSPGEWYAGNGFVHYMPLPGEEPSTAVAFLGTAGNDTSAIAVGNVRPQGASDTAFTTAVTSAGAIHVMPGTHDLAFSGLTFEHITWLAPSGNVGFVDLQSVCRAPLPFPWQLTEFACNDGIARPYGSSH